ncbi:NEDD4-binding protein 3-A-like isoform X2 [Polyodon spathula]|uniref:NEDD4-binding protein 3-A-like isoform X2 n=1 Tax=Polyodon spathula TaxID=7913 RepID=UPI001B7DFE4E|nr:NEDD4-binding protein 3-A-like isoform X2 [Polyodon spathula]
MATAQALPLTSEPSTHFCDLYPLPSQRGQYRTTMGSVGSLIEKPDLSPESLHSSRAVPQAGPRQPDGLLKKGLAQRELLNYLNITKKDPKPGKRTVSSIKREHGSEEGENIYSKMHHKHGKEIDLTKNSLPLEKSRCRPSAFKPVTPKNFSSMQNLYPSRHKDPEKGLPNGLHHVSYATVSPSRSGPARPPPPRALSQQDEENMSDSGHHSLNSLPPYRPPFKAHLGQISASMSHINHIGSLERGSAGSRGGRSTASELSCRSMATLHRLQGCEGEAPPPYQASLSMEDMVKDLEERLLEKEHELKHVRRNLDESEDAIAQVGISFQKVFEKRQRLWEKEIEELKRLYATKLRQISQQAQRSQRTLQLQLYKAQQEKHRLQEDLGAQRRECEVLKTVEQGQDNPRLEETKWEVCQKSGEISLLKQQLRDSQAEVAQKLGDMFSLKTQLRETRVEMRSKDNEIEQLRDSLRRTLQDGEQDGEGEGREGRGQQQGSTEERLRAELLLERRQNEAQTSLFESERRTWQKEKEKVIRYQKELQLGYLEMYHKNQALEKELQELRGGGGGGESGSRSIGTNDPQQPTGLPWIERIESSEI